MMYRATFDDNERAVLLKLIDIAVKAGGLPVAESAVVLARRLETAEKVETKAPE